MSQARAETLNEIFDRQLAAAAQAEVRKWALAEAVKVSLGREPDEVVKAAQRFVNYVENNK